ncbi:hypothetical protein Tdes44962_MAKER02093 [Teratosphaeria destructans]|uniref:Uncharacterized protein n=1 Tax=Teratosphaeria destructans TaxID=418781 RepID=A0A9W7W3Z5_9PEZI|nr:hypothetical protein Tdes44962_MAKER02093 [Teratosphaeria destructans]
MDLEMKQFCPYQARENPVKFILWLVFILLMLCLLLSGCASGTQAPESGNDDATDSSDAGKRLEIEVHSKSTQLETDIKTQNEPTSVDKAMQTDSERSDQLLPYMQDRFGGLERQMQQLLDCCHEGHKMKRSQACGSEDSGVAVQSTRIVELQQQLEECRAHGAKLKSQLEARDAQMSRVTETKGTQTESEALNAQNRTAESDEELKRRRFSRNYHLRRGPERIQEAEQRAKDASAAQKAAEKKQLELQSQVEQLQAKHKQASSQSEQESAARVSAVKEVEALKKKLQQAENDKKAAVADSEAKARKEAAARQQAEMKLVGVQKDLAEVQKAQSAYDANSQALQLARGNVAELTNQLQAKKEQEKNQKRAVEQLHEELAGLKKQQSIAAKQRTEYEAEAAVKVQTLERERDEAARKQRDAENQLKANTRASSVREQAVQKEIDGAVRKQQEAEKQAADHSALTERLENAERHAADLQKKLEAADHSVLTERLENAEKHAADLQKMLEDADKHRNVGAEAAQTVQTANQQMEEAVRRQREAEAARDEANRTAESAMAEHRSLAAERDALMQDKAMLESQKQQAFDANRNAEAQNYALQAELSNASQRAQTAEAQSNELRGQAQTRISELERQIHDAAAQVEQLRQELSRAHAEREDMSDQVDWLRVEEAELKEKLEECEKARRQQHAAVPELPMQSDEDSMTGTQVASETQPGQSAGESDGMDVEVPSLGPRDPSSGPTEAPPEAHWGIDPALDSSSACEGCRFGVPELDGYCSFCPPCETPGCAGREVWGRCNLCDVERPVPAKCSNQGCENIGKFNNAENLCPVCERCQNCKSAKVMGQCIYCCSRCGISKGLGLNCRACDQYRRENPELFAPDDLVLMCPECDKHPVTENGACHECQICQVEGCGTRMENGVCPNMCDKHEHLNMKTGKCDECEAARNPKTGEGQPRPKYLPDYAKMVSTVAPTAPLTTKKWAPVMPPKPGSAPPSATAPSAGPISLHAKAQGESEALCPKCGVALIATNCWQPGCGACIRCKGLLDDGVCRNDGCGVPDSSLMARIRADAIEKEAFNKKKAEARQQDAKMEAALQGNRQLEYQKAETPRRMLKPRRMQQRRQMQQPLEMQQPLQVHQPLQMPEAPQQTQQPLQMQQGVEMQHEPMQVEQRLEGAFDFRAGQQQNFGQGPKDQEMPDQSKLG